MLQAFSVSSYRSFLEETRIELRPITLLLGKNSSGKSSLTRLIPLLQQSVDRRTASPILWTSDVIDFGEISNVINHSSKDESVGISFELDGSNYMRYAQMRSPFYTGLNELVPSVGLIRFTARLASQNGRTRYKSTKIEVTGNSAEIFWGDRTVDALFVNGHPVPNYISEMKPFSDTTNLFPTLAFRQSDTEDPRSLRSYAAFGSYNMYSGLTDAFDSFINKKTGA